ncbi:unnamed protein product [Kuraishia capsulata CBS 1993]|uniref:Dihydroxyacetone kinase n=1 Tax=Kuraishia capsulata CBS 1993 TaxID=1382522 RepID=W6MY06_9ASCO|nr:uncharacterized protein KUCA_T00005793001 [Kuraishia capsulata CBS 1993]CDK29800.1 unnamed protein product [Kuraishia capsulata CBS 1993]
MSKHFLPKDASKIVPYCLKGAVYENETLTLLEKEKVIFNNRYDPQKVTLISGGGSGHEPGWFGFVGAGMLTASAQGDVFASPNYRNVMSAEKATHSEAGCIFLITNYTGDNLYFGMAAQELVARHGEGKVRILRTTDDVAVGRSAGSLVGRRTLPGICLLIKVLGAASELGYDIDQVYALGESVNSAIASVNAGLDHVHIPTHPRDSDYGKLGEDQLEIGLGIHNEPGVQKLDHIPTNEALVASLLALILDPTDPDRGFFKHSPGDKVAVQINNLGGVSNLEIKALVYAIAETLREKYGIEPARVYVGNFITSINAQIFTVTLFNVTEAATNEFPEEKLFELLDAPTEATNWPKNFFTSTDAIDVKSRIITDFQGYDDEDISATFSKDIKMDPGHLEEIVRTAALNVIRREPEITDWDTKMGDGDCGETLKTGAECILRALNEDKVAKEGSVLRVLAAILKIVKDDMGGTLGALLFIFLRSFISRLEQELQEGASDNVSSFAKALDYGLNTLFQYTKAREGHRTVMDVLIPFCRVFSQTQDITKAVEAAENAAEGTRRLRPKLGRATYVGLSKDQKDFPPDPGAYGVYEILSSLSS